MTSERVGAIGRINVLSEQLGLSVEEFRVLARHRTGEIALVAMNDEQLAGMETYLRSLADTKGEAA